MNKIVLFKSSLKLKQPMTNKIAIAVIAVLVIVMIVPTSYAQQMDVTKENYENRCNKILHDDRTQWHEFGCTYFPEIWNSITDILDRLLNVELSILTLGTNMDDNAKSLTTLNGILSNTTSQTNTIVDSLDVRLQILEGKISPPKVVHPLVVYVTPDSIIQGEKFTVYGHIDRTEQFWVDFTVYNPNGNPIQWFDITTLQNGGFYPPAISPNHNWNMNGTYTIIAEHGIHNATNTIQYLG